MVSAESIKWKAKKMIDKRAIIIIFRGYLKSRYAKRVEIKKYMNNIIPALIPSNLIPKNMTSQLIVNAKR
jgi:hypothetical protein